MQTLAELKAANEAEEAALQAETETETEEVEEEAETEGELQPGETETEDQPATDPESEDGEQEESGEEVEDWMKGDEGAPGAEPKFTDSDVAAARRKMKAKLEKKHGDEVEQLRQEIEELKKSGGSQPAVQADLPPHPKWEDFEYEENGSAKYSEALVEWRIKAEQAKSDAAQKAEAIKRRQQEQQQAITAKVDQHYDRAAELAEKSGIQPEQYQAADRKFRESLAEVYGGSAEVAEALADGLIAKLGPGSEKVVFNLGVNSARAAELQRKLKEDPSGFDAVVYLTDLKHQLQAPQKRKTTAPKPAAQVHGDSQATKTGARAMKKRYNEAKSAQARYDIKKEARAAKIDTSNW